MKGFLVTLGVSTVASIGLWNFGLAEKIWPGHAFAATVLLAATFGVVAQLLMKYDAPRAK